jgi:hypothetical protein
MPTLVAAAGGPQDLPKELLSGYEGYKVHLDGYNQLSFLEGETDSKQERDIPLCRCDSAGRALQ